MPTAFTGSGFSRADTNSVTAPYNPPITVPSSTVIILENLPHISVRSSVSIGFIYLILYIEGFQPVGQPLLLVGVEMRVGVQRSLHILMPEALCDLLRGKAQLDQQ